MWDRGELTPFSQTHASCTLASYAVALAKPSDNQVLSFFNSYVRHFALGVPSDAELAYATDFQNRVLNRPGFAILEELHRTGAHAFADARAVADCHYFPSLSGGALIAVQDAITNRTAVVLVATKGGQHVNCFGQDRGGAWMAETGATPFAVMPAGIAQFGAGLQFPDALLIEFRARAPASNPSVSG